MGTVSEVRTGRFTRSTTEEAVKPAERDAPKRYGIGLCLSGGGYRATLFHLGAARRLHELGILEEVRTISSVSGGSILAAKLAGVAIENKQERLKIENFDEQVAKPVREVTRHSVRTLPFILTFPFNWLLPGPRAHLFRWLLGRRLPKGQLRDLPVFPCFAICATDLTNGVAWVSSRDRAGSYEYGYHDEATRQSVRWAVAASACFPPVFGPLPLGSRLRALTAGRPRITLSDGGVYDNMGLEPVWSSHADILVSDAGAPFVCRSTRTPWGRLIRYSTVLTKQSHSLRVRMLRRLQGDYKWAFWDLDAESDLDVGDLDSEGDLVTESAEMSSEGYSNSLIDERIVKVRTDLDRFTEAEQMVLENHGYWSAEERVQKYLPHLVAKTAPKAKDPHRGWMDEERVRRALRFSRFRFWPPRMWPPRFFIKGR